VVLARHYLAGRAYATSINNDVCLHVTLMDCDHVAYSATKSDVIDRCLGDLHAKVDPDRSISHLALGYGKMLSFAYVRLVGASAELLVLKRGDVDRSFAIAEGVYRRLVIRTIMAVFAITKKGRRRIPDT